MKTIDEIKKTRKASDEAQRLRKQYTDAKKKIKECLKEGEKTIPQIAEATGMEPEKVTYYLMSMRKFHEVVVGEIDDMDEYFYYKLKN